MSTNSNGSAGPTWYDLLGVAPDASPEAIKTAWRDATDKFEPGSGTSQFRLFNEAADVLLNADRRAAYDAELAAVVAPPSVEPVETPAPPAPDSTPAPSVPDSTSTFVEPVETPAAPAPDSTSTFVEPVETPAPSVPDGTSTSAKMPKMPKMPKTPEGSGIDRLGGSLGWIALICAPILVAALVITGLVRHNYDNKVNTWQAGKEASAAADRALSAVLAYDYRHMDADRSRAIRFLTPAYGKKFSKTFTLLTTGPQGEVGPAVKTKTVVTADVLDTGVMDASTGSVQVVAFVNQTAVKGTGAPAIFQNRVVVTMVDRNGSWLIDDLKTY